MKLGRPGDNIDQAYLHLPTSKEFKVVLSDYAQLYQISEVVLNQHKRFDQHKHIGPVTRRTINGEVYIWRKRPDTQANTMSTTESTYKQNKNANLVRAFVSLTENKVPLEDYANKFKVSQAELRKTGINDPIPELGKVRTKTINGITLIWRETQDKVLMNNMLDTLIPYLQHNVQNNTISEGTATAFINQLRYLK